MLVLSRKRYERILVGNIIITVCHIGPNSVKVGITAPKDVNIVREELIQSADRPADPRQLGAAGHGRPISITGR